MDIQNAIDDPREELVHDALEAKRQYDAAIFYASTTRRGLERLARRADRTAAAVLAYDRAIDKAEDDYSYWQTDGKE